jgi:glycosyltransferase involved in cell wall biosynthesis
MHVCHIINEFYYAPGGLPYKQISEFSRRLKELGFSFTLITNKFQKDPNYANVRPLPFNDVKEVRSKIPILLNQNLAHRINSMRIDVVHLHLGQITSLPLSIPFIKVCRHPIILSVYKSAPQFSELLHAPQLKDLVNPSLVISPFISPLIKQLSDASQIFKIVVPSYRLKNFFQRVFSKEMIERVPPGVDLKEYQLIDAHNDEEDLGLKGKVLLYYGHGTVPQVRGLDVLLQAYMLLKRRYQLSLLFILLPVFGRDRSYIEKLKLAADHDFKCLMGYFDVRRYVSISDVVVFPYKTSIPIAEYPISIIESMCMKKVVVVSNVGALPEIVKHGVNGLIVEPNDPIKLANEIEEILQSDRQMMRLGENARKFVEANFDIQKLCKDMARIYEGAV